MLDADKNAWPDIAAALPHGLIAVIGVGAVEQHGAHLALSTDTIMSGGVARRIAEQIDGFLLSPVPYGDTWTAEGYPGTVSVKPETLRAILTDIGEGLSRIGVKALVIINGQFGNREPIALTARSLKQSSNFPVLYLDYPGLEAFAAEICDSKPAGPGFFHADEVETSMVLAIKPDAVNMALATAEYPAFPATFGAEAMDLSTFNKSGVFGDPRPATVSKGEVLIERIVASSVSLIHAFKTRHAL